MKTLEKHITAKSGIGVWCSAILCLTFCFLQTSTIQFNQLLVHEIWMLWFASLFVFDLKKAINVLSKKKYKLLYAFAFFYFLSSSFAVGAGTSVNRVIELFEFASPIIMFDYYYRSSKGLKYVLLVALLAIIIYNVIELIIAMNTYGLGLRLVHQEEDNYLKNSYNWAYSWVLITITAFHFIFCRKLFSKERVIVGVMVLIIALLGCYVVINSFFMTAIVSMLIGLVLSFTYGKPRWIMKSIVISVIGLLLFSTFYFAIVETIGKSQNNTEVLIQRVSEIYNITEGNAGAASDFNTRNDLTTMSLITFLKNPLFGINHEVKNFSSVQYRLVGDHSEWIDNLALYGLFSLLLFFFLVKSAKYSLSNIYFVFFIYLFMGFFNPVWYLPINLCLFFFVPLSNSLISEPEKTNFTIQTKE